jgi:hypothetical protein
MPMEDGASQSATGCPTPALPLLGQAALRPTPPNGRPTQNKGLVIGFQSRKVTSFFCFSRQILQIFTGNCEPQQEQNGPSRGIYFPGIGETSA